MTDDNKDNLPAITEGQDVSVMGMLADAVKDPEFDADKLEKLIQLKTQVDAVEAKKAFNDAMYQFHLNPPKVVKNKPVFGKDITKGPQYHFADFGDTVRAIRPALLKVGIVATWSSEPLGNGVTQVTCMLRHKLGHEEKSTMAGTPEVGGSKNAIQGVGSSDSYLRRYTLLSVTGLVAEGEDDDGRGGQADDGPISEDMLKQIVDEAEARDVDKIAFCKRLGVEGLPSIKVSEFGKAMKLIQSKPKVTK